MKLRFLSSLPCALTVGGKYLGITDEFERSAEIRLQDNYFACFSPQDSLPLGAFLNERLFFAPPEGVNVYLLRDGAAIYAHKFTKRSCETKIVTQERFANELLTVYFQGELFLSAETAAGFYTIPLDGRYQEARITKRDGLYFIEGNGAVCIFNAKGSKLFDETISSFEYNHGVLTAVLPLRGKAKRQQRGKWAIHENGCFLMQKTTEGVEETGLPAYDLLENFRCGAEIENFVSAELYEKKEQLKTFLGEYVYVFPCESENECGVLRKKGKGVFEADYFTVETENGKICDIKKF